MSIRHLDKLLEPKSIAVIGASDRVASVAELTSAPDLAVICTPP